MRFGCFQAGFSHMKCHAWNSHFSMCVKFKLYLHSSYMSVCKNRHMWSIVSFGIIRILVHSFPKETQLFCSQLSYSKARSCITLVRKRWNNVSLQGQPTQTCNYKVVQFEMTSSSCMALLKQAILATLQSLLVRVCIKIGSLTTWSVLHSTVQPTLNLETDLGEATVHFLHLTVCKHVKLWCTQSLDKWISSWIVNVVHLWLCLHTGMQY